jgi:hypothetical protein
MTERRQTTYTSAPRFWVRGWTAGTRPTIERRNEEMKKAILILFVVGVAVSALAGQARRRAQPVAAESVDLAKEIRYKQPKPDGTLSCTCHELQRRLAGMQALFEVGALDSFATSFAKEAGELKGSKAELESQVRSAARLLDNARGKSYADQERMCGEAVGKLGAGWTRWQPFLGQNKLDSDYYQGVKAANPAVPNDGDLEPNSRGRLCDKGQYWEEDRAWWAINGREGICEQQRYKVIQRLAGQQGDRGHRCFEYQLK